MGMHPAARCWQLGWVLLSLPRFTLRSCWTHSPRSSAEELGGAAIPIPRRRYSEARLSYARHPSLGRKGGYCATITAPSQRTFSALLALFRRCSPPPRGTCGRLPSLTWFDVSL